MPIINRLNFNPYDWYWFISSDKTRAWSSYKGDYVLTSDPTYAKWLLMGGTTTNIASELALSNVLDDYEIIGPIVLPKYVDRESYRRISTGFIWRGHNIQLRDEEIGGVRKNDQINVDAQAQIADRAVRSGHGYNDYDWCADMQPFVWRDANNNNVPIDAPSMIEMAEEAARWKRRNIWAASVLKDMSPIPKDFTDNKYWP